MLENIIIDKQFCGPTNSGNGGYCAGILAKHIDGAAEVTLMSPPPLNKPLSVINDAEQIVLLNEGQKVAIANKAEIDIAVKRPPTLEEAEQASKRYPGFEQHAFPGCFVCGPKREENDGLRIFPGNIENKDYVASVWKPFAGLADNDGLVKTEYIWAALDCPSFFGLKSEKLMALLGKIKARIHQPAKVDESYIVLGWELAVSGRKHRAASAIYDSEGELVAESDAIWIQVDSSFID